MSEASRRGFAVPYLSVERIEEAAGATLSAAAGSLGRPLQPPIPVENILEKHLKVTIEFTDLERLLGEPGILGAAWIEDCIVRLDAALDTKPGRLAFTIAHEIGHWQLHRPWLLSQRAQQHLPGLGEGPTAPNIVCRGETRKDSIEWQADKFAGQLLMPSRFMRLAAARLFPRGLRLPEGLERAERFDDKKDWIDGVAGELVTKGGFGNCSRQAMGIRIGELNLVDMSGAPMML